MVPRIDSLTLCVARPTQQGATETFIDAHIDRLPARVVTAFGGFFPQQIEDGRWLARPVPRLLWMASRRQGSLRLPGVIGDRVEQRAFRRFLRERRVDVLLAEYGPTGVQLLQPCHQEGVALVVHFHGHDAFADPILSVYGPRYRETLGEAEAVVAVSQHMRRQLLALGASASRLHVIPCGVDLQRFTPAHIQETPPQLLAIGRFVEKKAPHLTILAFARALEAVPAASLVMVGDGPLLGACKQLVRALGIEAAVHFTGVLHHAEIPALMQASRGFIQHSVQATNGDCEGTPVGVLEAGAAGLPVVATRHAGIVDMIADEENGLLVDEFDVDGMANRMIRLLRDVELAGRLGQVARERAERHYPMDQQIDKLWHVLCGAIDARRGATP